MNQLLQKGTFLALKTFRSRLIYDTSPPQDDPDPAVHP